MIKYILNILILLVCVNICFGAYIDFIGSNVQSSNNIYTDNSYNNFVSNYDLSVISYDDKVRITIPQTQNPFIYYFYKPNSRVIPYGNDYFSNSNNLYQTIDLPNMGGYLDSDLTGSVCKVTSTISSIPTEFEVGTSQTFTVTYNPSLEEITFSNGNLAYVPVNLLQNYYYMNTDIDVEIYNANTNSLVSTLPSPDISFYYQNQAQSYTIPSDLSVSSSSRCSSNIILVGLNSSILD